MSELKIGAYICRGCGLGERLDTAQLATIAQREGKAQVVREHEFLCNASGVAMIRQDIEQEGVNHVVIAACSRRAKTDAFSFDNVALSRANLREGVIWIASAAEDKKEMVQEMAADYVRMACAESAKMQVPSANPDRGANKRILVVGGGVSGMTAAREAAKAGYEVLLVEKGGTLGGWAAKLWKRVPYKEPYADPADTTVPDLVSKIESDKRVKVYLNSTIVRTSGAPGQFSVDIAMESGGTQTENVGAIVMASGFSAYDRNRVPHLGAGKSKDVVDQAGLEALARAAEGGPVKRPSDGREVKSVVFVQCAGQRSDKEGELPYCSGHCCNTSIKQAMYFKDRNPDVDTAILYTDLRTPGNGEDFYRSAQKKGVIFSKGEVHEVNPADGALEVKFRDKILDEDAVARADLVVLATGMVANSGVDIEQIGRAHV